MDNGTRCCEIKIMAAMVLLKWCPDPPVKCVVNGRDMDVCERHIGLLRKYGRKVLVKRVCGDSWRTSNRAGGLHTCMRPAGHAPPCQCGACPETSPLVATAEVHA